MQLRLFTRRGSITFDSKSLEKLAIMCTMSIQGVSASMRRGSDRPREAALLADEAGLFFQASFAASSPGPATQRQLGCCLLRVRLGARLPPGFPLAPGLLRRGVPIAPCVGFKSCFKNHCALVFHASLVATLWPS